MLIAQGHRKSHVWIYVVIVGALLSDWFVFYWSLQRGNEGAGGLIKSISVEIDCRSSVRKPERR